MRTDLITVVGTEIITAMDEQGVVYVAMKPFVEAMGLEWSRQSKKIQEDSRYVHMSIPYKTSGGVQEMVSLKEDHLYAFLYSINPNKVRKDLRETIIAFQNETFAVINAYWRLKQTKNVSPFVVNGYKSQIAQKNSLIAKLQALTENAELTTVNKLLTIERQKRALAEAQLQVYIGKPKQIGQMSLDERLEILIKEVDEALGKYSHDEKSIWSFYQMQSTHFSKLVKEYRAVAKGDTLYLYNMIDDLKVEKDNAEQKYQRLRERAIRMMAGLKDVNEFLTNSDIENEFAK